MGGVVLLPFLFLGLLLLGAVLCAIASAAILVAFAALNWLYRKCRPREYVPFNPDVIPNVQEPDRLLGG